MILSFFNSHKNSTKSNHEVLEIKKSLQTKLHQSTNVTPAHLSKKEQNIIRSIQQETQVWNMNNVTRTKAYLDFYIRNPEIHWSFLAHMVSRNGGWNMTDLKGEFLPKLLTEPECEDYFLFLERGNWLIFQDVFPQMLLYEKGKKLNTPLFHLLPYFHVSIFMEACWDSFWSTGNRAMLTMAMIVNEQNYLAEKLLKDEHQNKILKTIGFELQEFLSMSHIIFPIPINDEPNLCGQIMNRFTSTHERIQLGKRLYSLLFSDKDILDRAFQWASSTLHSGSRMDYWPHLFNDVKETIPGRLYNPQVHDCQLKKGASHLYSPPLHFAWKNVTHSSPSTSDWFRDLDVLGYLKKQIENVDGEIQNVYCKSLEKLAFTIFAKKAFFLRKE